MIIHNDVPLFVCMLILKQILIRMVFLSDCVWSIETNQHASPLSVDKAHLNTSITNIEDGKTAIDDSTLASVVKNVSFATIDYLFSHKVNPFFVLDKVFPHDFKVIY